MIVDVIDTTDIFEAKTDRESERTMSAVAARVYWAFHKRERAFNRAYSGIVPTEDVELILMPPLKNGVAHMVARILAAAQRPGVITLLRITGHGGPRWGMKVSAGHDTTGYLDGSGLTMLDAIDPKSGRRYASVATLRPQLERLTPYFSSSAVVELRGCKVAADAQSRRLLEALRDMWGVTVQAGEGTQYGGANWLGPVWEAARDGGAARPATVRRAYSYLVPPPSGAAASPSTGQKR